MEVDQSHGPPNKRARPTSVDDVVVHERVANQEVGPKSKGVTLTLKEIATDRLTRIAQDNWLSNAPGIKAAAFKPELVVDIYKEELGGGDSTAPSLRRVVLLEISQYLEKYLWPHFDPNTASREHILSMLLMVNEKFRENVPAWTCFHTREEVFPDFFRRVIDLNHDEGLNYHERTSYLLFMINTFQSLETRMVNSQVLRLVSLPLWYSLSPGRLQLELHAQPSLAKKWKTLMKREQKNKDKPGHVTLGERPEAHFFPHMLSQFLSTLDMVVPADPMEGVTQADGGDITQDIPRQALLYCERFLEFLIDLLSQLPTRRFVHTYLEDRAVLVKCRLCSLYRHAAANLYRQLVDLLQFYMSFPIDNATGEELSEDDLTRAHYEKICALQRLAFKHIPKLRELALSNCAAVAKRESLKKFLNGLSPEELKKLVIRQLRLVGEDDPWVQDVNFLMEVMLTNYEARKSQRELINEMPLYPTERIMWDKNQIPDIHYTGGSALALPKLNLQFLTPHDYLLRNFHLFRLEATYEIREDIQDVLARVGAALDYDGKVQFKGWARMALAIQSFKIIEVGPAHVGENKPSAVTAEVVIDTSKLRGDVRGEWDEVKQHDVLFLLTVRPPDALTQSEVTASSQEEMAVPDRYGLQYVRGGEVIEIRDETGKLMNDYTGRVKFDEITPPQGFLRTVVLALDTAQYQLDINQLAAHKGGEDLYSTFNLVVRRKPKENNFKAVLQSIRDVMNEAVIIPDWLKEIFLGYGDPAAAQWEAMDGKLTTVDFKDTFLDAQHLRDSFPEYEVKFVNKSIGSGKAIDAVNGPNAGGDGESKSSEPENGTVNGMVAEAEPLPPFRITFPSEEGAVGADTRRGETSTTASGPDGPAAMTNGHAAESESGPATSRPVLLVEPYQPPDPGPYPQDQPRQNQVRFTPVQVQAILSGSQPGLTMVVGPPGTGKTDTAVQIMHVLYHNCPGQRTLLITHSNQALNDLFQKILQRDVPSRYLLRLGQGERELETNDDFSRVGRVNDMLARRLRLLAEVEKMARQFGVSEDVAYTCETAGYFWLLHVLSRWEKFLAKCEASKSEDCVKTFFPFKEYFAEVMDNMFQGKSYEEDMEKARGCFRHLRTMFQELEEIRPFELLKGQADRINYLMTKQAKIVAMTCTHAALKRHEFIKLAFKYDNLLMEEAAQILEIETFIPMLLQRQEDGVSRLKRVVLIGDHHQLPPVVKNMAFQKYSHLDQSLFTRFIRLGTPYLELNSQGRARATIAKLYNWRYRQLGDLPYVLEQPEYLRANPGFAFDYQFINVEDMHGQGEYEPVPYFYQNLGEAEYLVSVYQFMRLLGYPAERISVLTTYNGQKHLLRDVFERRCARHPFFGRPHRIATVDKYQGQQNDYVLLSLVRTRVVGHLRDVRRLVVAMSRARLGLYVFGRAQLFGNCYELQPTFQQLLARPAQLALVKKESYGHCNRGVADVVDFNLMEGPEAMAALAAQIAAEQEATARGS